jgi:hypothetical protein
VQHAALSSTVTIQLPALKDLDLAGKDVLTIRISGQKTVSVSQKAKNIKLRSLTYSARHSRVPRMSVFLFFTSKTKLLQ